MQRSSQGNVPAADYCDILGNTTACSEHRFDRAYPQRIVGRKDAIDSGLHFQQTLGCFEPMLNAARATLQWGDNEVLFYRQASPQQRVLVAFEPVPSRTHGWPTDVRDAFAR